VDKKKNDVSTDNFDQMKAEWNAHKMSMEALQQSLSEQLDKIRKEQAETQKINSLPLTGEFK
jgi:hypothetical protein